MNATQRVRALRAILGASALVVGVLLLGASQTLAQPAPEEMQIDWSMPDRYGADENGDGLVDSYPPDGSLEIEPDGFHVNLLATGEACSGSGAVSWKIDGRAVGASDRNVVAGDPLSCSFTYRFEEEGTFDVSVQVADSGGTVAEGSREVRVRDFLIVSIGDSVASGEGNPDVPFVPRWQNRQCHRSALAGPALAAKAIEDLDPRSSVTFVHLACSGATTLTGLLGAYEGQEPGELLPPQVDELERLAGGREIDAVLVSIGANDVRFSKVVEKCLLQSECTFNEPGSAARQFSKDLAKLPGRYDLLAAALAQRGVPANRVYLTEYFDPTRDDAGRFCDKTILADFPLAKKTGFVITAAEAQWASETMMPQLNLEGARAAARHGWNRVSGIRDPFLTHGYCAKDHWVVRYAESMPAQGNKDGTLHPNRRGHELYGLRIAEALAENLLDEEPLSVLSSSPLPDATVDEPYTFTMEANRPAGQLTWRVTGGELPEGLELSEDGVLEGTPEEAGDFDFVVEAAHASSGQTAEKAFELEVVEAAGEAVLGETLGSPAVDVRPDGSTAAIFTPSVDESWLPESWRLVKAGPDGEVDFTVDLPACSEDFDNCWLARNKTAVRVMPDGGAVAALMLDDRALVARFGPAGQRLWERSFPQFNSPSINEVLLAVASDGRIALAANGSIGGFVECPELERTVSFVSAEYVELDAEGATIGERRLVTTYEQAAACDAAATPPYLGGTLTRILGLAVAADGDFVAVGDRNLLGQGDVRVPIAPPSHFRSDLDTIQELTVPAGTRLRGLAASGDGLYVGVGAIWDLGWVAPVTLGRLEDATVTALDPPTPLSCSNLTSVAGMPGSLLEVCPPIENRLTRLSDEGEIVASRTFENWSERAILGAVVGSGGQVFTVEARRLGDEYPARYEITRRVLNPDLSDPD